MTRIVLSGTESYLGIRTLYRLRQYKAYHKVKGIPNIIVDGSPTDNTILSLSHWKRVPTPEILKADVAAEVTFNYPEYARKNKDLLIGIAKAGDFQTYSEIKAARISFIISSYSFEKTSPLNPCFFQKKSISLSFEFHRR